jgi:hypothetical protein
VARQDDDPRPVLRSGTGDDADKMAANVRAMEAYALPLFRAGHVPVVGEWFALPLVALAGFQRVGDEPFEEIFHPVAERLLERCDAVLRVGGPSQGRSHGSRRRAAARSRRLRDVVGCDLAEPWLEAPTATRVADTEELDGHQRGSSW